MNCKICGSFAINHHLHGRDGSDPEFCDVCYWRKRAKLRLDEAAAMEMERCAEICENLANSSEPDDFALDALNNAVETIRRGE